jgi:hypothetical protein
MPDYYFPEIEQLVGRPYSKSTRYILIGLLIIVVVIGIVYFLIATGYISSVSPSDVNNPKNIQNGSPQSGSPINTNNTQTSSTTGSGNANSNNPNPSGTNISGNGQNLNGNGNIIY